MVKNILPYRNFSISFPLIQIANAIVGNSICFTLLSEIYRIHIVCKCTKQYNVLFIYVHTCINLQALSG